jgi:hypothetical protein
LTFSLTLRFFLAAAVVVLVALWLVGPVLPVPAGSNQYPPPPTPRPGELSIALSADQLSDRLGMPVRLAPNVLTIGSAAGHVDLVHGKPLAVIAPDDVRRQLQALLDQERARIDMAFVKSVSINSEKLLLIGSAG